MVNLLIETESRGFNLGEFLTNEQDNISLSLSSAQKRLEF